MSTVKIFDIRWVSHTAGPSPVKTKFGPNARIELFFMGCKKAAMGNPCKGCFNPALWQTKQWARELDPKEMASHIEKFAPQKYITIVGGECFDQPEGLVDLCEALKEKEFHTLVFTHYGLESTFGRWKQNGPDSSGRHFAQLPKEIEGWTYDLFVRFLKSTDILVDGEYEQDKRIYDESLNDGFHNAIGSSNQIVWDLRSWRKSNFTEDIKGQESYNIESLVVKEDGSLDIAIKDNVFKTFPTKLK